MAWPPQPVCAAPNSPLLQRRDAGNAQDTHILVSDLHAPLLKPPRPRMDPKAASTVQLQRQLM